MSWLSEVPCESKEEKITRIMAQYGSHLKRLCFLYLRDEHAAQDAAQETFFKVYKHLDSFRGDCAEKTWITRIAVNTCRDMLRTAWFRRIDRRVTPEDLDKPDETPTPDRTVSEAVMRLPARYREIILLYYYQNMNTSEIAQALRVSVNTVKSRLLRGKEKLKNELEGWYFDE